MEDIEYDNSEHDTNERGNTEHEITEPETTQDANTKGPEEGDPACDSTAVAAPGSNNSLFLYVFERNSSWVTLTLDLEDPNAPKMQLDKNRPVDLRKQDDADEPFHIDYYTFKYGYTLRLNNCGHTTLIKGHPVEGKMYKGKSTKHSFATIRWKEFHMHLPADRWHAQLKHEWPRKYSGRAQGMHKEDYAKHNVIVFPKFMDKLEEIIGEGRIRRCKLKDGELVDVDAEDEAEGEEGEDSSGEDGGGEAEMEESDEDSE